MTNQEFFKEFGSEQWAVEQNLSFLLLKYFDTCRDRDLLPSSHPPINTVSFVKEFMKQETEVDLDMAEASKQHTLERDIEEIEDGDFREI